MSAQAPKTYLTPTMWKRIRANQAAYEEAERLTGVPWRLLAAIHYRENDCLPTCPRPGGAMQKDPPWTRAQVQVYEATLKAGLKYPITALRPSVIMAAAFIQREKANPKLTPNSSVQAQLQAAFRYNGTSYGSLEKSPYVSNDPLNGTTLMIKGTLSNADGTRTTVNRPDTKPGIKALLRELTAGEQSTSNQGDPLPDAPTTPPVVYYPIAGSHRMKLGVGQFLDPAYRKLRNAWHPGQDINVGNTATADLGEPVYAIADGIVTHVGWHSIAGNIIEVHHPALGVWSLYWHVIDVRVVQGQAVTGATQIAGIGAGDPAGNFTPHLHFEIRRKKLSPGNWPGDGDAARKQILDTRYDPIKWLRQNNAREIPTSQEDLHPVLIRVRGDMIAWLRMNRPEMRLVTTRTFQPTLRPTLGPNAGQNRKLGPHDVRPALAFDYQIRNAKTGQGVAFLDPLYTTLGKYAEKQGALWGPDASPPPANEGGNLRNHIQLKNADEAIKKAQESIQSQTAPAGGVDTDNAAEGSSPEEQAENRRAACPAPPGQQ